MKNYLFLGSITLLAGCGGGDPLVPVGPGGPVGHPAALEAAEKYPTGLLLHEKVVQRSCSPNGGVCHNSKEYPDLHTFGNLVQALDKPCNRDKADEPEAVFDGCEPEADVLVIAGNPEFRSRIARIGAEEYPPDFSTVFRRVMLEDEVPVTLDHAEAKVVRNGRTVVELKGMIFGREGTPLTGVVVSEAGQKEVRLTDLFYLDYRTYQDIGNIRGGDPNNNGSFGASQPWMLIAPGFPAESYLIGRITGTVPGTRMPLANQPLTDAEYVALFCWIETLDSDPKPTDAIDYENCGFAHDPVSYSILNR